MSHSWSKRSSGSIDLLLYMCVNSDNSGAIMYQLMISLRGCGDIPWDCLISLHPLKHQQNKNAGEPSVAGYFPFE